ncbi:hypothetical protein I79_011822 [Cricetulus griseus]|uniref:Uncharacterized protein n=1 Tax=Cricetulus griseus TaxID=10029 RepID=G3HM74_CRIGR|nr:hypothetical protein I79_011822 [Cricetulus griseus]
MSPNLDALGGKCNSALVITVVVTQKIKGDAIHVLASPSESRRYFDDSECFTVFQLTDVLMECPSVIVIKEHFSLVETCSMSFSGRKCGLAV